MAALRGDSDSQIKLADMYTKGEGVDKDIDKAIVYLEKAANGLGRAVDAQMILGYMYYKGEEVPKNDEKALLWFKKAAENEKIQAQSMLGLIYSTSDNLINLEEAAKWYEMAANQGDVNAEFNYGLMLFEGKGGLEQDYGQALTWFKKAMAQHHQGAQTYVGAMYANGFGTPRNYSTALRWLIPVAEEGYVFAQGTIADIYTKEGNVNNVRAYMWYDIAVRNGLEEAKGLRDDIAEIMKEEEIAEAKKKADEWIENNAKKQAAKKAKAEAKKESDSAF
jgi:TPR repeat protein